jgi:hypothetical protein
VELARREVLSPTLATTREVLAVHSPVLVDDQPLIARSDLTRDTEALYFYFRLVGEPYYLVVVVSRAGDELTVASACIEAAVRVFLLVRSEDLTPDEITKRLGLDPTAAYPKGDRLHPELAPLAHTMWRYEPHHTLPEEVGRKLDLLLDLLEDAAPRIAALAQEADVQISISYEGCKEWLGCWNAPQETLQRLAALGVDLHFDLYASGPDFPEPEFPDPQGK